MTWQLRLGNNPTPNNGQSDDSFSNEVHWVVTKFTWPSFLSFLARQLEWLNSRALGHSRHDVDGEDAMVELPKR
jgi:hypothetical protein